jgi:hypothetical protein
VDSVGFKGLGKEMSLTRVHLEKEKPTKFYLDAGKMPIISRRGIREHG